jgi:hypothetical protein
MLSPDAPCVIFEIGTSKDLQNLTSAVSLLAL